MAHYGHGIKVKKSGSFRNGRRKLKIKVFKATGLTVVINGQVGPVRIHGSCPHCDHTMDIIAHPVKA